MDGWVGELIHFDSHEEYNAYPAIRSTALKTIMSAQGPRAYYLENVNPPPDVDRAFDKNENIQPKVDDFVLGILLHEYALEGKQNWFVTRHTRGSKAWLDDLDEHDHQWALTQTNDAKIRAWRDAMMRNHSVRKLVEDGSFQEQSFVFDTPLAIKGKARVDLFSFDGSIWDLKSTRHHDRKSFDRQIVDLRYDFSAAFYEKARNSVPEFRGMQAPFRHIVLCKSHPYYCYIWELDRSYLRVGHRDVELAFQRLAECQKREAEGMDPMQAWPDLLERNQDDSIAAPEWYLAQSGFRPEEI